MYVCVANTRDSVFLYIVHYARPVILLGMLTSQVAEALLRFPCGMKFLRSSSTGNDLRKFAEEVRDFEEPFVRFYLLPFL